MSLFSPSSRLLLAVGESQTAQKFILSSKEWFDLQNNVQAVLALPSDFGEYEQRYGDASSGSQMKECFDAMYGLQNVALRYGNPKSLRAKILQDPNLLAKAEKPRNDAFSATLWTLERAHQNAFSLASALRSIPTIARGEQPSDVVTGIKSLFLDTDQIVDSMRLTVEHLDELIKEFQKLEDELAEAQAAMKTYTTRSSKTRVSLDSEIGDLKDKIAQLEKNRDAAYEKWLALTVSACIVPAVIGIVGTALTVLLIPATASASLAVGGAITTALVGVSATALGVEASNARSSYEELIQEVSTKQELFQKRLAYRHDLGALDNLMRFSLPTSHEIINQVKILREAWDSSMDEIRYKVANLHTEDLANGPWLKEQEMSAAAANWVNVDNALQAFIKGSFVDSNLIAFGNPLPKDDPRWQEKLTSKFAA